MSQEQFFCKKCTKTMNSDQFYGSNNLEKYPAGKLDICKKCATLHVDNWDPETYMWIIQECDVPYVHEEWLKLLQNYVRGSNISGTTILGRYLSKMKLKQFKQYRWKDTEFLQELADSRMEQAMKRQGYSAAEITMAQEQKKMNIIEGKPPEPEYEDSPKEDYFDQQLGFVEEDNFDLTEEEKTYLRLKWGKSYRIEEWVKLEQLYEEMMSSYDIQGAGHIDTLKLMCKTSLKANQLIDMGDVEGFQKMQKAYDSLMKSGKFTAAQNKAEQGEFVDSVGELIELCEKQGYIERFYIDTPNDKVDLTIQDMQRYTKTLIEEETNLSNMVEQALKQIQKEDEDAENNQETDIVDDDSIDLEDIEKSLKDDDFTEFSEFLEEETEEDLEKFLEGLDI